VLRPRAAAALAMQQLIDISYLPGPEQQIRHKLLQQANSADRWTPYHFTDHMQAVLINPNKKSSTAHSSQVNYPNCYDNSMINMVMGTGQCHSVTCSHY